MILKKSDALPFTIFFCLFLLFAGLIAATFGDLTFSQKLYRGETAFTAVLDVVGKVPGYLGLGFACSILSQCVRRDARTFTIVLRWLYILATIAAYILLAESMVSRFTEDTLFHIGLSVLFGLCLAVINLVLVTRMPRQRAKELEKWCVLAVLVCGIAIVLTGGLKFVWGRVRFNAMSDPLTQFTPWYKPNHSAGGDSFPSGHTALAATLLLLPILLRTLHVKKWGQLLAWVLSASFLLLTPISRVMGGYHFASDVIISLGITFTAFVVCYLLLYRNKREVFTANNWATRLLRLGSEVDFSDPVSETDEPQPKDEV